MRLDMLPAGIWSEGGYDVNFYVSALPLLTDLAKLVHARSFSNKSSDRRANCKAFEGCWQMLRIWRFAVPLLKRIAYAGSLPISYLGTLSEYSRTSIMRFAR